MFFDCSCSRCSIVISSNTFYNCQLRMLNGSHYPKTWILQSLSSLDVIDNPFIIMFPPGIFLIVK